MELISLSSGSFCIKNKQMPNRYQENDLKAWEAFITGFHMDYLLQWGDKVLHIQVE